MIGWDGTGQALRRGGESESKGKRHGRDQDRTEQNRTEQDTINQNGKEIYR